MIAAGGPAAKTRVISSGSSTVRPALSVTIRAAAGHASRIAARAAAANLSAIGGLPCRSLRRHAGDRGAVLGQHALALRREYTHRERPCVLPVPGFASASARTGRRIAQL